LKTIIEALFAYFDKCPLELEYTFTALPPDDVIKRYTNGGEYRRYPFIISSVNDYSTDTTQNIADTGFAEKLADWLHKQTRSKNLPDLPNGLTPRSIRVLGAGYLQRPDVDTVKHQIQCELEYYKKGEY